jgi:hypothetical protein
MLSKGILQLLERCSVRISIQKVLNQFGLIHWIMDILKNASLLQENTLECLTALLMNLVLHNEGRKICEAPELESLKVLTNLLGVENLQVKTTVNGTLYSLMFSKVLRDEAKVHILV